jgi:hypothetical protein
MSFGGSAQLLVAGIFDAEEIPSIEPLGDGVRAPPKARIVRGVLDPVPSQSSLERSRDSK